MGDKSTIEWTDSTWNPVTGCTKVSQGCKNCYAKTVHDNRHKAFLNGKKMPPQYSVAFEQLLTHPDRLAAPLHWRKPRRIFVNSMSDLFHEDIPSDFIESVFHRMAMAKQHTFQVLTKRPERMFNFLTGGKAFSSPLPNVWLGVSVEDRETWLDRSGPLKQTPAAVRFISYEPTLADIGLIDLTGIHWLIAGGESGPHARPAHPDWFRSARDQCAAAGVPFFFKQWGEWAPGDVIAVREMADVERVKDSRHFKFLPPHDEQIVMRVGKKAAGRLLDGREHSEYPT